MSTSPALPAPFPRGVLAARRLHRAAERERQGRFLVEGPQGVREAARAGVLVSVFATEFGARAYPELLASVPITVVGERALDSLAQTVTPQGLIGVAKTVLVPLSRVLPGAPSLVTVLVDARDPGNAGTVLRTSVAAGADAVIFAAGPGGGSVDPQGGKCVRACAGSLFHIPVARGDLEAVLHLVRAAGLLVLAADSDSDGTRSLEDVAPLLGVPSAWFFGNEAHGLPEAVLRVADHRLRVPLHGPVESLNLAAAAAVCLYASARAQRGPTGSGDDTSRS